MFPAGIPASATRSPATCALAGAAADNAATIQIAALFNFIKNLISQGASPLRPPFRRSGTDCFLIFSELANELRL